MKVLITEYLRIDLETENWECRRCDRVHGSARETYKKFLLIYPRNPREIHRPILDPDRYRYNFSPDPAVCVIYEFYCPSCGTLVETEYTVPGRAPLHDIEFDIDALKRQWSVREPVLEGGTAGGHANTGKKSGGCGHAH